MTNEELDQEILKLLREHESLRAQDMLRHLDLPRRDEQGRSPERQIDGCLKRLKKRGLVQFSGVKTGWTLKK